MVGRFAVRFASTGDRERFSNDIEIGIKSIHLVLYLTANALFSPRFNNSDN